MRLIKIIIVIFSSCGLVHGQTGNLSKVEEINIQVWHPFKQAFESRNDSLFNSLHTDDMLRINESGMQLGEDYKTKNSEWKKMPEGTKMTIDFSFEHRFYNGDIGYEVGYYRVVNSFVNGNQRVSYGRFHVILKKLDGIWKITQDWDTGQIGNIMISEEFFNSGTRLKSID
jgi:ketosteroid isomerase-like protein